MSSTFVTWRTSKLLPPLNGPMDELFAGVFGAEQDTELALLRVAALSRFPATCPDDGLDLLGQAYTLPRMPSESHDSYRARLVAAWDTWEVAGSPDAIVKSLHAYGITDVEVFREEDTDYTYPWYSRFDVSLGPDFGVVVVARPLILDPVSLMSSAFTQPAVGASVTMGLSISDASALVGTDIYVGQGGYYHVTASGFGTLTATNLGNSSALGAQYGTLDRKSVV